MQKDIKVSVICLAYNHEKYIRDALESFIMQKTSFCYEVLVHDDASTDDTAKIIKEYEEKYPEIIKGIYQTENQHSKKIRISDTFLIPRAQGKYAAFCEGDDFWISPDKLQMQYDYMEAHPECSLCISNAKMIEASSGKEKNSILHPVKEGRIVSTEEVIAGGGGYCATNSIFTRTVYLLNKPSYFSILSIDLVLQMYLASMGTTYCFSDELSAYRCNVTDSWTVRMKKDNPGRLKLYKTIIAVRNEFDKATNGKYRQTIQDANSFEYFNLYRESKQFDKIYGEESIAFYNSLSPFKKFQQIFTTNSVFEPPKRYAIVINSAFEAFKIVGIISGFAFYVGLQPFDYSPTIWKVLVEGIIYCFVSLYTITYF